MLTMAYLHRSDRDFLSDDRLSVVKLEETTLIGQLIVIDVTTLLSVLCWESSTVCAKDIESLALSSCQVHDHHQPTDTEFDVSYTELLHSGIFTHGRSAHYVMVSKFNGRHFGLHSDLSTNEWAG